jgi:hypothetical protein
LSQSSDCPHHSPFHHELAVSQPSTPETRLSSLQTSILGPLIFRNNSLFGAVFGSRVEMGFSEFWGTIVTQINTNGFKNVISLNQISIQFAEVLELSRNPLWGIGQSCAISDYNLKFAEKLRDQ